MRAYYPAHRREVLTGLQREIEALIGVRLSLSVDPELDYDGMVAVLCAALDARLDPSTRALVEVLSSDRANPLGGFVDDLAEILFLERFARREYVQNRQVAPPYQVRKLLLEYAVWSWRLDALVDVVNKGFCAAHCDKLPIGCCHILGYDLGLVPEAMLDVQRLEAERGGWREPPSEDKCRYHTDRGCVLALFKSPACVGYLCDPLLESLAERYPGDEREEFLKQLAIFRNCDLDRRKVFEAMEATVMAGRRMLAAGATSPDS